jgi:hypothetical protein
MQPSAPLAPKQITTSVRIWSIKHKTRAKQTATSNLHHASALIQKEK